MYESCDSLFYKLSYSARERKQGGEAMFFSAGSKVPKVASPACLTSSGVSVTSILD